MMPRAAKVRGAMGFSPAVALAFAATIGA